MDALTAVKEWKPNQNLVAFLFIGATYIGIKTTNIAIPEFLNQIFIYSLAIFLVVITLSTNIWTIAYSFTGKK